MGIPPPMVVYLQELYGDASTSLWIGPDRSEPIGVSWGVRQGDPLSVHLFNAVIDWALATLEPELGVMVGELRVNAGAFADNIALIARTSRGLQSLLDDLSTELQLSGLEISTGLDGKSASLRIDIDGKRKKWIVNPLLHLQVFDQPIPAVSITEVQQYLGVPLSPMRTRADVAGKLTRDWRTFPLLLSSPSSVCICLKPTSYLPLITSWYWLRLVRNTFSGWTEKSGLLSGPGSSTRTARPRPIITLRSVMVVLVSYPWSFRIHCFHCWASNDPVIRKMLKMETAESILASQHVPTPLQGVELNSPESLGATKLKSFTPPLMTGAWNRVILFHHNIIGLPELRVCWVAPTTSAHWRFLGTFFSQQPSGQRPSTHERLMWRLSTARNVGTHTAGMPTVSCFKDLQTR